MSRFSNPAALLTIGIALAGCAALQERLPKKAMVSNRTSYSENQPVVEHTNYALDLATGGEGIPGDELARLVDWFDSLQLRYGDHISVEDPSGRSSVRSDVARVAAQYGLLLTPSAPITPGAVPPGSARVIVSRATASVPGCPNWRQAKNSGAPISTESNYGCATNTNIALMVADPDDLVLGQKGSVPNDAATASKAIRVYREKEPTGKDGLEKVSTTGGN